MNSSAGFKEMFKLRDQPGYRFADLLDAVANEAPEVRIRFTSPHPKDFPLPVLQAIKAHNNICKQVHIPAQSGSSRILQLMRRNYSREAYLELIQEIRHTLPGVAFSSDFIAGFCSETEDEFQETLTLIQDVKYDFVGIFLIQGFLFAYSMRDKTHAMRTMADDVPEEVKKVRLQKMIDVFIGAQLERSKMEIGRVHMVLVDGVGKKPGQLKGKTDTYRTVIFETSENEQYKTITGSQSTSSGLIIPKFDESRSKISTGDHVLVEITGCTSGTLFGKPLSKSTFNGFFHLSNNMPFISSDRLLPLNEPSDHLSEISALSNSIRNLNLSNLLS
jgi:tRNA A37 methylthiotransferase MiaB